MSSKQKRSIREKLKSRDGSQCWRCKRELDFTNPLSLLYATIDHRQPRALGGTNHLTNLSLACYECNNAMGMGLAKAIKTKAKRKRFIRRQATQPLTNQAWSLE